MNLRLTLIAAAALLAVAHTPALAQGSGVTGAPTGNHRIEVSPFFGYRFGGDFEDAETGDTYSIQDGSTFGLMIDFPLMKTGVRTELLWCRQDSSLDLRGAELAERVSLTIDSFELGAIAEDPRDRFVEYISAHVGLTHFSADGYGSDTRVNLSAGVGAKFFFSPRVALKAEVRAFCTFVDGDATFIFADNILHITYAGSTMWQGQATVGLSVMF